MVALIIQTILLMAIAFILGCVLGCLLRNLFGGPDEVELAGTAGAEAGASASAIAGGAAIAGGVAATARAATAEPAAKPAPVVPKPPVPAKPVAPAEKAETPTPPASLVSATPPAAKKSAPKPKVAPKPKAAAKSAAATAKPTAKTAAKATAKPTKADADAARAALPTATLAATPDNLKLIKGIGPQNEGRLNGLGVNTFAQISKWTKKDQKNYGTVLAFPGRIEREDWVSQAKTLAKGGQTDFAKRVKSGSVSSSVGKAKAGDMGKEPKGLLKAARGGKPDNLTLIDGVGNAIEQKMFRLGIYHFDQVAKMTAAELTWLSNGVGFPGRAERENWKGESKILAAGGTTDHAKRVEKGQIKTSRKSTDEEKG